MNIDLKRIRKQKGMTQHNIAEELGCSQATVAQIENGKQSVSVVRLARLAQILDVHVYTLIPCNAVETSQSLAQQDNKTA